MRGRGAANMTTAPVEHTVTKEYTAGDVSVGVGEKGGVEFREWMAPRTYRVRTKYYVWARLSDVQREWATTKAAERKAAKGAKSREAQAWRELMRGG